MSYTRRTASAKSHFGTASVAQLCWLQLQRVHPKWAGGPPNGRAGRVEPDPGGGAAAEGAENKRQRCDNTRQVMTRRPAARVRPLRGTKEKGQLAHSLSPISHLPLLGGFSSLSSFLARTVETTRLAASIKLLERKIRSCNKPEMCSSFCQIP